MLGWFRGYRLSNTHPRLASKAQLLSAFRPLAPSSGCAQALLLTKDYNRELDSVPHSLVPFLLRPPLPRLLSLNCSDFPPALALSSAPLQCLLAARRQSRLIEPALALALAFLVVVRCCKPVTEHISVRLWTCFQVRVELCGAAWRAADDAALGPLCSALPPGLPLMPTALLCTHRTYY